MLLIMAITTATMMMMVILTTTRADLNPQETPMNPRTETTARKMPKMMSATLKQKAMEATLKLLVTKVMPARLAAASSPLFTDGKAVCENVGSVRITRPITNIVIPAI